MIDEGLWCGWCVYVLARVCGHASHAEVKGRVIVAWTGLVEAMTADDDMYEPTAEVNNERVVEPLPRCVMCNCDSQWHLRQGERECVCFVGVGVC